MLPPRIPMNRIGKITVKASESGLLTARRTSRQAIANTAFDLPAERGASAAGDRTGARTGGDGWPRRRRRPCGHTGHRGIGVKLGAHATASSSGVRRSST